jgi:hypothetical protein
MNHWMLANVHNLQDENSLLFQILKFNFLFNHCHNRKLPSSNNIWKWTLKLNPMVATKCNAYKSLLSHPILRNCVLKYTNVTCISGWLLCLAMSVSLDKYEKKLSTLMGIECLVVKDEVNIQVCTIIHKCVKTKMEVFKKVWLWTFLETISKNDMQLVQRRCLVMGLACTITQYTTKYKFEKTMIE